MSRPLLITDCDEVLLHMVVPLGQWLDVTHDIIFDISLGNFAQALRHRESGELVDSAAVWPLLEEFFTTAMHRQRPIVGAVEAIADIAKVADVVVLTNIGAHLQDLRVAQLRAAGIDHPVIGNRGGKGPPLSLILAERNPSVTVFVDDIGHHHDSVQQHAPAVWRLHMIGEPQLAAKVPPSKHAHVRIDDWVRAKQWILDRFAEGPPGLDHDTPAELNPA